MGIITDQMLKDEGLEEDLLAALLWEERKNETTRPFRAFIIENEIDRENCMQPDILSG